MKSVDSRWLQRYGFWVLVAVALFMLLPGTTHMPLLDRDEPRFSQATWEMMERGDWVVPYFNGEYRFDKPPLTYWWMRIHYWIFGKSEIGARLHSVLAALLVAWGIFRIGIRMGRTEVGWLAAFGWLTCMQVFQHGRLALADMPMIATILFANWAWFELLVMDGFERHRRRWFWVLWASLGLGFLAKGPLAILVPLLTLLVFRFVFWRKPLTWSRLRPWSGMALALGIVAAWGIPALLTTKGLFWDVGMGKHVIERGVEAFNDRKVLPFYYLLTALLSLFPWFGLMGRRLALLRQDWDAFSAFLVSWIVVPYLVFLAYSTQLPHYVMPAFPAWFLWVMAVWTRDPTRVKTKTGSIWFWVYASLWAIPAIMGLIWVGRSTLAISALMQGMLLLFAILVLMVLMLLFFRFGRFRSIGLCIVLIGFAQWMLASHMRQLSISLPVADMISTMPDKLRLVGYGYEEPSLVFYTGRLWNFDLDQEEALVQDLQSDAGMNSLYVILDHEYLVDQMIGESWGCGVPEKRRELGFDLRSLVAETHILHRIEGLNFARTRWSIVWVLVPIKPPEAALATTSS